MTKCKRVAVHLWQRVRDDLGDNGPDWYASVRRGLAVSDAVRRSDRKPVKRTRKGARR